MQLQGLMMMLFFIVVIPIIIMSTNHNVFFVLIALVLSLASLKNIKSTITYLKGSNGNSSKPGSNDSSDEEYVIEELEEITNVNIKKFSIGIGFVKNLVIILFFVYSSFYLSGILYKSIISIIILHRVYLILNLIPAYKNRVKSHPSFMLHCARIIYDLFSVFIIVSAAYKIFLSVL